LTNIDQAQKYESTLGYLKPNWQKESDFKNLVKDIIACLEKGGD